MKTMQTAGSLMDDDKNVLNQLDKILKFPKFSNSDTLSRFLQFVVHETLAGRQAQLKEYTIAVHALNKPVGFLPSKNGIIRIHANRLRSALLDYYDQKNSRDDWMISIPKGRYIPVFEKLEKNQSFIKPEKSISHSISVPKTGRIAFIPFRTYDRNIDRNSLIDSLSEELTRQFSYNSDLTVLSYHTTRTFSPEKTEIKNLVSLYKLQYVISGSIRFDHSKIRIFIELIDAISESQIWSGVYYRTTGIANHFKVVDIMASELMSDLSKIRELECEHIDRVRDIDGKAKEKSEIVYLDDYGKNPKSTRRVTGT